MFAWYWPAVFLTADMTDKFQRLLDNLLDLNKNYFLENGEITTKYFNKIF